MKAVADILPLWFSKRLSSAYSCVTKSRNWMYDNKILKEIRVSKPVISVGNLTVGGTGKTPLVIKLAHSIWKSGLKPAVISRGYGGTKGRHPEKVPENADHREYGDETALMARVLTKIPVVVSHDRAKGARWIIDRDAVDCLLLDDGFQHRRLARDCNIVMLDSRFPFTQDKLLPLGRLRETVDGLIRADIIVFSHTDISEPAENDLKWLHSQKNPTMIFFSSHVPVGIRKVWTDQEMDLSGENNRIALISSIGSPSGFKRTAEKFGLNIQYEKPFRDHKALTKAEWFEEIHNAQKMKCTHAVITAKDESRYPRNLNASLPVCVLDIVVKIDREEEFISHLVSMIKSRQES
ncbi:MAG: tetraacyldisaccharide 4'-kinase [bacterium]